MQTEHLFNRDEVAPSWWANALNRMLSQYAEGLSVVASDPTHIQIPAGPDDAAALVSIGGLWRYMESTLTVAMPGGAAGDFDVFLTAKANDIVATPAPYTDNTDYSFAVEIHPVGTTPTIAAGVVDAYRWIARVGWSGTQITYVNQVVPVAPAARVNAGKVHWNQRLLTTAGPHVAADGDKMQFGPGSLFSADSDRTIDLPPPAVGSRVRVVVTGGVDGAHPLILDAGAGVSVLGQHGTTRTILMGTFGASVEVEADGANWEVVSGEHDTGWVLLGLTAGIAQWGDPAPAIRFRGGRVELRGSIQRNSGAGSAALATIPASPPGLRPVTANGIPLGSGSDSGFALVALATNSGDIGTNSFNVGSVLTFTGAWWPAGT